ncbi:MAG TPA: hypothetical protein VHV57_12220 [Acidimicrobiales bacterium]|jgi:hypothetical protein|nr:hypothetical protein [Acidimicrobiales bacterium]
MQESTTIEMLAAVITKTSGTTSYKTELRSTAEILCFRSAGWGDLYPQRSAVEASWEDAGWLERYAARRYRPTQLAHGSARHNYRQMAYADAGDAA